MNRVLSSILTLTKVMHWIAGACLVFLMLLTVTDIVLRGVGKPIPGTYALVGFAGGLAIGLAMPLTSWGRGHVYVDILVGRMPRFGRTVVHLGTRLLGIGLFALLGWNLFRLGFDLRASGEVSPTLELRYYPVLFGIGAAAFVQAVVLLCHMAMIWRGEYE